MIASLKGYGRIARAVLGVIAGLLVLGMVGSLVMSVRATNAARDEIISQATSIADSSLTLAFTPEDLAGPVSLERAIELTEQIQAIVVDPSSFDAVTLLSPEGTNLYSTATSRIGTEVLQLLILLALPSVQSVSLSLLPPRGALTLQEAGCCTRGRRYLYRHQR